jgi:peptide-methionine (S)-S-oxide reductase
MSTRSHPFVSMIRIALPALAALAPALSSCAERATAVPPPAFDEPAASAATSETAVLAGGCFWGVQAVFQHLKGVQQAVSGYAGGSKDTAEYERVGTGRTGHAETVRITFDPRQISYGRILQVYFSVAHDPTQLDRQGPDHGNQYRSDIFVMNETQRRIAQQYVAQLGQAGVFGHPIVTRIDAFSGFYPAEDYHQDFATLNPDNPYIVFNDLPKLENLQRLFPDLYRPTPVLVGTTHASR